MSFAVAVAAAPPDDTIADGWTGHRGLARLEPALEGWCRARLGPATGWRFSCRTGDGAVVVVALSDLQVGALEVVRTATQSDMSAIGTRLLRAAGPAVVAFTDGADGADRYQDLTVLAEALRAAMAGGGPLLASHLDATADPWAPADLDELAGRIDSWIGLVTASATQLTAALDQPDALAPVLDALVGAGLRVPAADTADERVAAATAILAEIAAAQLPEATPSPVAGTDPAAWLATATAPVRALLGDGLPLLPVLRLEPAAAAALLPANHPADAGPDEVADWLREHRPGPARRGRCRRAMPWMRARRRHRGAVVRGGPDPRGA